jgi:hypothetical protein
MFHVEQNPLDLPAEKPYNRTPSDASWLDADDFSPVFLNALKGESG